MKFENPNYSSEELEEAVKAIIDKNEKKEVSENVDIKRIFETESR